MIEPVCQDAHAASVHELERRSRRLLRYLALVAVLATLGAATGTVAVVQLGRAQSRALAQFCDVRVQQRHILEHQWVGTLQYLRSPIGRQHTGLNDYIRKFSVPQLKARMRSEIVPPVCKS